MKTKDIDIKDHHYFPDADVFLIRGYRSGSGKNLPRAVVGWMFRTSPANTWSKPGLSPDIPAAMKAYQSILESGAFPDKVMDAQDKFKQKVYDWEDHILHPAFDIPVTSPDTARKIIRRISREMEIPCPKLVWSKNTSHSEYDDTTHIIDFGHRELLPLLHELAHATHSIKLDEANNENAMHHSPGFGLARHRPLSSLCGNKSGLSGAHRDGGRNSRPPHRTGAGALYPRCCAKTCLAESLTRLGSALINPKA